VGCVVEQRLHDIDTVIVDLVVARQHDSSAAGAASQIDQAHAVAQPEQAHQICLYLTDHCEMAPDGERHRLVERG
jgi:hypothetical protein